MSDAPDTGTVTRLVEAYGTLPRQDGEWFVPPAEGAVPTVVLVHGGFWRARYGREIEEHIALDLAARGYLVWNIDYRSSAEPWPALLTDVATAYDFLLRGQYSDRVDRARVAVVGHSAGGHLAAWVAGRHRLPSDAPGYNPSALVPALAVPRAGVVALTIAANDNVGSGAALELVGGPPAAFAERYREADPMELLPTGVRTVLIHDRNDEAVPFALSEAYVRAATRLGDDSTLIVVPGTHMSHIDSRTEAADQLRAALATMSSAPAP